MRACKILLVAVFFLSSCECTTLTKEKYLEDYSLFITDIKQNYRQYDESQWKEKDKEYRKLNDDLLVQFKDKLTSAEQMRIIRYDFVYNLVRGNINVGDLVSGKYNQVLTDNASELTSVLNEITLIKKDVKDVISIDLLNKLIQTPSAANH